MHRTENLKSKEMIFEAILKRARDLKIGSKVRVYFRNDNIPLFGTLVSKDEDLQMNVLNIYLQHRC